MMKAKLKENLPRFLIWLGITAVLVILDQITKTLAVRYLQNAAIDDFIPYIFNLVYVENRGAAWGMLANHRWIFISVSSVAVVAFAAALFWFSKEKTLFCVSLALILAGGIGNMIDRICFGYVVDFLQFAFFTSFPVFNGADSFVTVGGAIMIIYILFTKDNVFFRKQNKTEVIENETSETDNGDGGA